MQHVPNTLSIFGNGSNTADIALRNILKFKESNGAAIILDYTGRGALVLNEANKMSLQRREVIWCDLADRLRPVTLLHLERSEHFRPVLLQILKSMRDLSKTTVDNSTLEWAVEAGYSLSQTGTVGLGALLKSLSSPEVRRWHHDTQKDPRDLNRLLNMLSWALRYPAAYAISEGVNRPDFNRAIIKNSVLWIECRTECFEKAEHTLVAILTNAAIEDIVKKNLNNPEQQRSKKQMMTIMHLFPHHSGGAQLPAWVEETGPFVRHVAVHNIDPDRALRPLQLSWATRSASVWVAGKLHTLKQSAHTNWLKESEIERINGLERGDIWVKSNDSGKSMVAKVRYTNTLTSLAYQLNYKCAKARKIMPVRQMATAITVHDETAVEDNIFTRLCDKEMLRLGWFKIQTTRKASHGIDNVTIAQFKERSDDELTKLAQELKAGEYRARPLFRVQIPKVGGGMRTLGIPCVRDRVVQSACLMLMEPIFETLFSRFSFAFRPHRRAYQALAMARSMIKTGRTWAVIADIKKCFDSIDHDVLLRLVSHRLGDKDTLNLIHHWLTVDVLDFGEIVPIEVGVPQGASISPLLANVYLDPLDKHFEKLGISFVRYADDIIILTQSEEDAQKSLQIMQNFLMEPLHLELKPAKTNITAVTAGFDYLGFRIDQDRITIRQSKIDDVQGMLLEFIKTLGEPAATLGQRLDSLVRINEVVRGWRNYFALPDEIAIADQLHLLDGRIEQMANYYLPVSVKDDPAWLTRERFCMPGAEGSLENEQEAEQRGAKTGNGYPEHSTTDGNVRGLIKKDTSENEESIKHPTVVIEDAGEKEETEEDNNNKDSLVEDGDRLYVLTHGSYLTVDGDDLLIKKRKSEFHRRPLDQLGLLYLQGFGMNISVSLQLRLAELDIPVVFAPPVGEPMAVLNSINSSRSFLRGLQVIRRDDPDVITAGLKMLASKIMNQAAVLRYFTKYRKKTNPDLGWQLTEAADAIRGLADTVLTLDPAAASVRTEAMGYEGHAASLYWQHIIKMLPQNLGFMGRTTRAAKDLVNQCLNYTYGILYGEVWRAIVKVGLDPYFGLMHGSKRDQGSLVFDLICSVLFVLAVVCTAGCGRSNQVSQSSSIAPPEAIPQHAEFKRGLPPAGWTSGVAWVVAVHDTRAAGTSSLEVDWVRFYCTVAGQETQISGESATNGTGVDGGGLYTRNPWFGNNDAHTTMSVNFSSDIAVLPLSTIPDKVWHFWGSRVIIPSNASRCFAAARVRLTGNALVQLGLDFWKDQNIGWCGLDQCNTEGSTSDWYGASLDWITIYSGKP